MDIQNNSIVTDVDTELLDSEIDQISNYLSETHCFDNEQEEELELLVAKAMQLGELYERKKWQEAKAHAVREGFVLVPVEPTKHTIIEIASVCLSPRCKKGDVEYLNLDEAKEVYQAAIKAQEPANDSP